MAKTHTFTAKLICLSVIALNSCADFLSIDPPRTQIADTQVFSSDATAISSITGIYSTMMNSGSFASGGNGSMSVQAGLSADEFTDLSNTNISRQYFRNSVEITNTTNDGIWTTLYQYVYYANNILEHLESSSAITLPVRNQIQGEALFVRAFSYYYLVSLFGDVPLIRSTDFKVNSVLPRSSVSAVYESIIADLVQARDLMAKDYAHASANRVRPNSYAASALLARAYLSIGRWQEASEAATAVIMNTTLYEIVPDLNKVFLRNSREAIWQLMPTNPQFNTFEGQIFRGLSVASLSAQLLEAFQPGDARRVNWVIQRTNSGTNYQMPYKYKVGDNNQPVTEYSMVLRLAECYLTRAEAMTHLKNFTAANSDLNVIRRRAGLSDLSLSNEAELLAEAMAQRRNEFFSEWGHRWLDLKRTGTADEVLKTTKAEWNPTDILYPIPKIERDNNPNLTQNDGY